MTIRTSNWQQHAWQLAQVTGWVLIFSTAMIEFGIQTFDK
ncbi:hypothetical protein PTET_b0181 [Pseudoalteromonas tetraodonis]|nr:hypothetical protein PTET_b0181 [Pseudoalteromonas tetraodonis]